MSGEYTLQVIDLNLSFGGVTAVQNLSFRVPSGQIYSIIGPNGAGKTSVLNCINGFYKPQRGRIIFNGREITDLSPHKRAQIGIARVFQGIEIYRSMSVIDNIMTGRHIKMNANPILCALFIGPAKHEEVRNRAIVEEIIDFLNLEKYRKFPAGALPIGIQKRVALGRALALEPELLLLDEPMSGMSIEEKEDMCRYIIDINEERGITIILVEHDMSVVKDLSHTVMVMDRGMKIAEGRPQEVFKDMRVVRAYVGESVA
ncbi:MAG: ABC transporter ATP-binding protein [Thaumarchaeota archaeon]|nr:ABC transporter ATP-binding protein [Candidatus Calditenuaceae archaeon]MDW8043170.1 ABC transporter ATP-binding protein [Nitrososphaerota archaeon]